MPKMIKIGEIRVLIYFDLPWNEPLAVFSAGRWELRDGNWGTES